MRSDANDIDDAQEAEEGGEPQSMESLLAEQAQFHEKLEKKEVVWVKVVQITAENVLVDIGEKREAVIGASEFPPGEAPAVGRRVPAVLVSRGRGDQPTRLSTARARSRLGWEQAEKAFADKSRVRGKVLSAVKGGFMVDVGGVSAFLPASLADLRPVRKPELLIGTGVRCYIVEMNKDKSQLILSRKAVLEEEAGKRKEKLLSEIKTGEIRIGRVVRLADAGVVIDVGGLEGVVETADVAWKEPEKAKAALERGQKLRVRVLRVAEGKVALGIKQLTPHPGDALRKKYPLKAVVKGKVSEILTDGVRIKLSDSVNAFCPTDELPVEGVEVDSPRERRRSDAPKPPPIWPKAGEEVSGIVTGIQPGTYEVAVSLRRYEAIQDRKRVARYLKGAPPLTLGQLLGQTKDE